MIELCIDSNLKRAALALNHRSMPRTCHAKYKRGGVRWTVVRPLHHPIFSTSTARWELHRKGARVVLRPPAPIKMRPRWTFGNSLVRMISSTLRRTLTVGKHSSQPTIDRQQRRSTCRSNCANLTATWAMDMQALWTQSHCRIATSTNNRSRSTQALTNWAARLRVWFKSLSTKYYEISKLKKWVSNLLATSP